MSFVVEDDDLAFASAQGPEDLVGHHIGHLLERVCELGSSAEQQLSGIAGRVCLSPGRVHRSDVVGSSPTPTP
jgi:hypothetical protein